MAFKFEDAKAISEGVISLEDFKFVIRNTTFLTPKEKNLLIRLQKNDTIRYSEFPDMLYSVRYEIAISEMMDYNMDQAEEHII